MEQTAVLNNKNHFSVRFVKNRNSQSKPVRAFRLYKRINSFRSSRSQLFGQYLDTVEPDTFRDAIKRISELACVFRGDPATHTDLIWPGIPGHPATPL